MRSTGMIRAKHVMTTLAAVPAAFLLTMAPAHAAGHSTVVYTSEGGSTYGGKALFWGGYDWEAFEVCDTKSDGMAARAYWSWKGGSVTLIDANGSTAFCDKDPQHIARKNVPENAYVDIKVCRVKGGKDRDCTTSVGRA
ncbi:hypothetical protein KVH02_16800 [Streptomyces olivaceus]|uniref:Uncharacterized protein n=1 Tax=Streptomyces olivaceus TaxID=47716 RepID=A0ABS7W382_STROV|nr:hypothetical protein [Streptomyces olivaceus]MBZ6089976.1 hypothetical protein [Streptomyces olivaceus]MBZ6098487.1 hypothetical protein [Streptomyces olivaceus]MBZ6119290.1 hypothetical protein [Streptomyces olivaceus]MBZ6151977.1 hypothetical protein [Streptomyces olivaceus]MBZ6300528.1 hypothetical protein [Streptomyces olivaceus]